MGGGPSKEQRDAAAASANLSGEMAQYGREQLANQKAQQAKIDPYAKELMTGGNPFWVNRQATGVPQYQEWATTGNPFFGQMEKSGLPYYNALVDATGGDVSRSFAPAYGTLNRRLAMYGTALPSGFATGARTDLDAQRAAAFDQQLNQARQQQFAARTAGAQAQQDIRERATAAQDAARVQAAQAQEEARLRGAQLIVGQQAMANPSAYFNPAMSGYGSIMNAQTLQRSSPLATIFGGAAGGAASAIPF